MFCSPLPLLHYPAPKDCLERWKISKLFVCVPGTPKSGRVFPMLWLHVLLHSGQISSGFHVPSSNCWYFYHYELTQSIQVLCVMLHVAVTCSVHPQRLHFLRTTLKNSQSMRYVNDLVFRSMNDEHWRCDLWRFVNAETYQTTCIFAIGFYILQFRYIILLRVIELRKLSLIIAFRYYIQCMATKTAVIPGKCIAEPRCSAGKCKPQSWHKRRVQNNPSHFVSWRKINCRNSTDTLTVQNDVLRS